MGNRNRITFSLTLIFLVILTAFHFVPSSESVIAQERANKKWTFMVYLDADNNLENPYGHRDIDEMKAVGSDADINIVVLWDGRGSGDGELYYITDGGADTFPTSDANIPEEPDMADPDTLDSFIEWAITNYPADHYALSIWDHGSGIFRRGEEESITKGFCNDEHGGGEIELWELNDVLANAKTTAGKNIDVVGFDVCYLGYMETHYQMMPYVDYGVASEATEPGDGWDYQTPLAALAANPDMAPGDFASEIVSAFINEYSSSITQAAVDIAYLNNSFLPVFEDFSVKLTNYMYHYKDQIESARSGAQTCGQGNARDLYDFAKNIQQTGSLPAPLRNAASAVMGEWASTVIEEGQKGYSGAKGMLVYFPSGGPSSTYTSNIDMAASKWDEFLVEYNNPQLRYDMNVEVFDEDGDGHEDDVKITVSDFIGGVGEGAQISVDSALIGTTNASGVLDHYDLSKGPHSVMGDMSGYIMNGEFTIVNRPPVALAVIPGPVEAGESVRFNGTLSSDPDNDLLSYIWIFGDGGGSASPEPEHIYEDDGIFNVSLIVVDTDSVESAPFKFDITVENLPPLAEAGDDVDTFEDEIVYFDGSSSWDTPKDKAALLYQWDFGDGSLSDWLQTPLVNHTYSNSGLPNISNVYTVELLVKDDNDITSQDRLNVTVDNVAPVADAGADIVTYEDVPIRLDGVNSSDTASDVDSLVYQWDLDAADGLDFADGAGMALDHTFNESGRYTATLGVTDDNGEISQDELIITVRNVVPVAEMPFDQVNVTENEVVYLNGSMSTDSISDMDSLDYTWTLENGEEMNGINSDVSFMDPGIYNVTLTVTDDDGDFDTHLISISVANVPPKAVLDRVHDTEEDETIIFNASGSTDTTNDILSLRYIWDLDYDGSDFTEDKITATPTLEYVFTSSGEKNVMVKVLDNNDAFDTASVRFNVLNVGPVSIINLSSVELKEDDTLYIDGSDSYDSSSDIDTLIFEWKIGDQVIDRGKNRTLTYTFADSGKYTITLEVTDDDGAVDISQRKIEVLADPANDLGSILLSPSFSNMGIFIYLAVASILFIVLLLFVIRRKRKASGESTPAEEETAEEVLEETVQTEEERKREYRKLYGSKKSEKKVFSESDLAFFDNETGEDVGSTDMSGEEIVDFGADKNDLDQEDIGVSQVTAGDVKKGKKKGHSSKTKKLRELRSERKKRKKYMKPVSPDQRIDKEFKEFFNFLDEPSGEDTPDGVSNLSSGDFTREDDLPVLAALDDNDDESESRNIAEDETADEANEDNDRMVLEWDDGGEEGDSDDLEGW